MFVVVDYWIAAGGLVFLCFELAVANDTGPGANAQQRMHLLQFGFTQDQHVIEQIFEHAVGIISVPQVRVRARVRA